MRLWRKSKYTKILELVEKLSKDVQSFKNTICDLEDLKEDQEEVIEKENKLIATLETENKMLRERLHQKDIYLENLLSQLLGGVGIGNLLKPPSEPTKESKVLTSTTLPSTMSAKERYRAALRNGSNLPG